MIEDTHRQVLLTATGFAARQAIAALRKHNIEVAPLLRHAGLQSTTWTIVNVASRQSRK